MNDVLAQELVMSNYDASEYASEEMPVMGAENDLLGITNVVLWLFYCPKCLLY